MNRLSLVLAGLAVAASAGADTLPPPSGVVNLQATATAEVTRDLMSVTFTTTREGTDANAVQAQLKQALDAALTEARRVAKPGLVDVRTGNFALYPRYSKQGLISGWHGTAELVVEGRDMPAIGQLAGKIGTMTVGRVNHELSRETREKSEADVTAQAIGRYRARAAEMAKQFGYAGYTLREVNVMSNEPPPGGPVPMMRAQMAKAEDAALPAEAGKANVSVTVHGSIQLTR